MFVDEGKEAKWNKKAGNPVCDLWSKMLELHQLVTLYQQFELYLYSSINSSEL